ncbi:MAG: SH3 domain-containing protein [Saprospiraceae bacterium]|nr:SH3 domain-containing protein [Saprospiraceae bacterium]
MRNALYLTFAAFGLLWGSCQSSDPSAENAAGPEVVSEAPSRLSLTANIDYLRIRKEPGQNGEVVGDVSVGDSLFYLGEVSAFTTRVKLRGIWFDEPWIKVERVDGLQGWVYAGGLNIDLDGTSELARRILEQRLSTFFSPALARSALDYRRAYEQASTAEELAAAFRHGSRLRDSLNAVLEKRVEPAGSEESPDLSWLEGVLPGYLLQLVAEGTQYHLFQDYRALLRRADRTPGREDDQFAALMAAVFPIDSIEHFYPAWFLQTWDYGGHSELGKGVHRQLLDRMNRTLAASNLFEPEIEAYKDRLLEDILEGNEYWYDQPAILQEIDQILQANFGILSEEDRTALQRRRAQFADPGAHGIELNFRSGEHGDR